MRTPAGWWGILLPNGAGFAAITPADVQHVEAFLNNRLCKPLNCHSPNEVFGRLTATPQGYALEM
jgi:IS30 family transposase